MEDPLPWGTWMDQKGPVNKVVNDVKWQQKDIMYPHVKLGSWIHGRYWCEPVGWVRHVVNGGPNAIFRGRRHRCNFHSVFTSAIVLSSAGLPFSPRDEPNDTPDNGTDDHNAANRASYDGTDLN